MYGNPYINTYNPQASIDRINSQIAELEKLKQQIPPIQPTNLTQNFQIAPTNKEVIRYANSIDEVKKDLVIGDTPYFSKDMAVLWVKNTQGDVKTYELKEIPIQDEKDVEIAYLKAQIEELKKGVDSNAKSNDEYIDEPIESEKPSSVQNDRTSKAKSKQSYGNVKTNNK